MCAIYISYEISKEDRTNIASLDLYWLKVAVLIAFLGSGYVHACRNILVYQSKLYLLQVRSATLDTWLPEQVAFIQCKLAI